MPNILGLDHCDQFPVDPSRSCFTFDHRFHLNDMFDTRNLVKLAERLPDSYYATNDATVGEGWNGASAARRSLTETIATIAETNSLVLLKGLVDDRVFGPVVRAAMTEVLQRAGETLRNDVSEARATLVVSSPGRITPYHIDAEVNFLLQLRGEKRVNVFDPNDRTLLTEAELEAFYGGDPSAATYKPNRQSDAAAFAFAPGKGLYIPLHAPHWTKNGDSVSVAISFNFSLRSNATRAILYKFNRLLRRAGLSPTPPGTSGWQDRCKLVAAAALSQAAGARPRRRVQTAAGA